MLDEAARHRIDPEEFVLNLENAMTRDLLRGVAEFAGKLASGFTVDADRDRLIDDARD
jgi:hypothetical protein